ncbi:lactate utilization protein C, partial [Burkholderia cenocepacia]|nr:lactate utilization protein C [Burkholderia cenocepacia]
MTYCPPPSRGPFMDTSAARRQILARIRAAQGRA